MKVLCFIFLLLNAFTSYSQTTEELFSQEGLIFAAPHQSILTFDHYIIPSTFFYEEKAIYCDKEYLRYRFAQKPDHTIYLRVDGKKVYYSREGGQCDYETLMYDFGLDIGDQFVGGFHKFEDFIVTQKDSVEVFNGEKRLRIKLEHGPSERIWIEGIGDTRFGIDLFGVVGIEPSMYGLSCVVNNDGLIYKGSVYSDEICDSIHCIASISKFDAETEKLTTSFINNSLYAESTIWKFGDGISSTEINPDYEYDEAGCYEVKLITTDNCNIISNETSALNNVCFDNAWKKVASTKYIAVSKIKEYYNIVFAFNDNGIYRSDDNMDSWDYVTIDQPSQGRRYIEDLKMFDAKKGILVAINYNVGQEKSALFYTENGGRTWIDAQLNAYWLRYCELLDNGVAVAYDSNKMYRTEDYGVTWSEVELGFQWSLARGMQYVGNSTLIGYGHIKFPTNNNFYLFKSTDMGVSIDTIHLPNEVIQTYFIDEMFGFGYNKYSEELSKTLDGGLTWELMEQSIDISNMHFLNDGVGFVNTISGKTLYTENYMEDYTAVQCSNDLISEIFGDDIDKLLAVKNRRIVEYRPEVLVDCIKTSSSEEVMSIDPVIYPNPTNTKVIINGEELSSVLIMNGIGEKVEFINFNTDSTREEIDLSELSNGIYFFKIKSVKGGFVIMKVVKI